MHRGKACEMMQVLWRTEWLFLKMPDITLPCGQFGRILERTESRVLKMYWYTHVHSSATHNG
jgi:hypothetical protein